MSLFTSRIFVTTIKKKNIA